MTCPLRILYAIVSFALILLTSIVSSCKSSIKDVTEKSPYRPFLGYLLVMNLAALCWIISMSFFSLDDVGDQHEEPYSMIGRTHDW